MVLVWERSLLTRKRTLLCALPHKSDAVSPHWFDSFLIDRDFDGTSAGFGQPK